MCVRALQNVTKPYISRLAYAGILQPGSTRIYAKPRLFSVRSINSDQGTMVQLRGGKTTKKPSEGEELPKSEVEPNAASTHPKPSTDSSSVKSSSDSIPIQNDSSRSSRNTRILNLKHLPYIPTAKDTPESRYRQVFDDYLKSTREQSPPHADARGRGFVQSIKKKEDLLEEAQLLQSAISSLRADNAPPVAFPTETVYGLGADATNANNVKGIFAAKGRPGDNPLIVHVSSIGHLERCLGGTDTESAIPEVYRELIATFWPGPLTILVPVPEEGKGMKFAPNVHPGQKTIGFRMPKSSYARFLIALADRPIAAPSANSSGKPSPTSAIHVKEDLDGKVDFILDGGDCDVGVESTVVDGLSDPPLILRPGGLSKKDLRAWGKKHDNSWQRVVNGWEHKKGVKRKREDNETNGAHKKATKISTPDNESRNVYDSPATQTPRNEYSDLELETDKSTAPRAPGMKYKHYAPAGRMYLFESDSNQSESTSIDNFQQKLGELLNARNTEPNGRNRDFEQYLKARAKGGPGMKARIHALPYDEIHRVTVGVLTTTSWPSLPDLLHRWPSLYPGWWDSTADVKFFGGTDLKHIEVNLSYNENNLPTRKVTVYNIELGKSAKSAEKNLFAALRSCDGLSCEWIFAEAPSREIAQNEQHQQTGLAENGEMDDEFETVLERMRKAASEIIQA